MNKVVVEQELVGFSWKRIPLYGICRQTMWLNFRQLRWVVAEKTVTENSLFQKLESEVNKVVVEQEVVVGFSWKRIPRYGIWRQTMWQNFRQLRCVVAEKTVTENSSFQKLESENKQWSLNRKLSLDFLENISHCMAYVDKQCDKKFRQLRWVVA